MSFQNLFEAMNIKSAHWQVTEGYVGELIYKARSENKKLLHYLHNYEAVTQMDICLSQHLNFWPQIDLTEEIAYQYPTSTFILHTRNPEHILKSVKKWGNLYQRILDFREFHGSETLSDDEKIIFWIDEHYRHVRKVFSGRTNFIEFDIENDSIEKLRVPLNIPDTITTFPHANPGPSTKKQSSSLWKRSWNHLSGKS